MGCFSPDAPPPQDYGKQTSATLNSQIALNPTLASANLEALNRMLMGTQDGTRQVTAGSVMYRDPSGNITTTRPPSAATGGGGGGGIGALLGMPFLGGGGGGGYQLPAGWTQIAKGSQYGVPQAGQPGLIDTYTNRVAPAMQAATQTANTAQRTADIRDVANLGPEARAAILAANPQNAQLLDLLNQQAIGGLQAGTSMTPEEARQIQQASRGAFAARGMGGTNASIGDELIQQYNLGQQLLRQRQMFAQGVVGTNQSTFDPMMALTGRQSGVVQQSPMWTNQMLDQANIYNPESSYSGNIYNANQQMAAAFADPSTLSKIGAVSNTVGSFIGSIAGGMI